MPFGHHQTSWSICFLSVVKVKLAIIDIDVAFYLLSRIRLYKVKAIFKTYPWVSMFCISRTSLRFFKHRLPYFLLFALCVFWFWHLSAKNLARTALVNNTLRRWIYNGAKSWHDHCTYIHCKTFISTEKFWCCLRRGRVTILQLLDFDLIALLVEFS